MYEASGQWSTTYSQPSALTDWWERRGEEGGEDGVGRRWSGGCILTIRRSILSSLNLPSFLPPLYPIYPFFYPTFTPPSFSCLLPHLLQPLSLQLFCPPLFCFHVFSPLPHLLCVAPRFIPRASGPENQVSETKKKKIPVRQGNGRRAVPLVKVPDLG